MTNYGKDVDETLLRVLRIGEQALARVRGDGHWEDWMQLGEGLLAMRTIAMRRACTNVPTGRRYSEEMSLLLQESPYHSLDKGPRSFVIKCADNRVEIEAWRATLSLKDKMAWSYPKTVWGKFQAYLAAEAEKARIAAGGDAKEKRPSIVKTLKERNAELEQSNVRLERMAGGGSHIDLDNDTARDIAKVIVGKSLSRARSLLKELAVAIREQEARLKKAD